MCNRMCTKGFLNYFSVIIEFLIIVLRVKLLSFQRIVTLLQLKESGGVKFQLWNFKRIIIIINYQNGSEKPRKFSRSRMTKRTAPLNLSREI